jgi:hypothetical protein
MSCQLEMEGSFNSFYSSLFESTEGCLQCSTLETCLCCKTKSDMPLEETYQSAATVLGEKIRSKGLLCLLLPLLSFSEFVEAALKDFQFGKRLLFEEELYEGERASEKKVSTSFPLERETVKLARPLFKRKSQTQKPQKLAAAAAPLLEHVLQTRTSEKGGKSPFCTFLWV